jgi:hypothetical protein
MRHTLCRVEYAVSVAAFLPGTVFYVTFFYVTGTVPTAPVPTARLSRHFGRNSKDPP